VKDVNYRDLKVVYKIPLTEIIFQVDISDSHGNEYENASGDGSSTHV
jgi:hypothetical protein